MRAQARRAVVFAAGRQRRLVESVDLLAAVHLEGNVDALADFLVVADPERIRLVVLGEADGGAAAFGVVRAHLHQHLHPKRSQCALIERPRARDVGDRYANMAELHARLLRLTTRL